MPASRSCGRCGAAFPADVRWCGRCYEPVRELTPRAPLHGADFVSVPHHTGGFAPHWSRWEKSATTFGPAGRIGGTLLLLATVPAAIRFNLFVYVVAFPVVAFLVLPAIWARGWVIPGEVEGPPLPVPERPAPVPTPPLTAAMIAWKVAWIGALVAAGAVFAYGPVEAKAGVVALGALGGLAWFFRGFLSR